MKIVIAILGSILALILVAVFAVLFFYYVVCENQSFIDRAKAMNEDELQQTYERVRSLELGLYCRDVNSHSMCRPIPPSLKFLKANQIDRSENYGYVRLGGCLYGRVGLAINYPETAGKTGRIRLNPGSGGEIIPLWQESVPSEKVR